MKYRHRPLVIRIGRKDAFQTMQGQAEASEEAGLSGIAGSEF